MPASTQYPLPPSLFDRWGDEGRTLDPTEAPEGYVAVRKATAAPADGSNICRACDWRPHCTGKVRCMAYTVIETGTGRELKRKDGCSVVFKKKETP